MGTKTRRHIISETRKIYSIVSANRSITGRQKDQIVRLSCQKYYAICSKTAANYFSYQSCPFESFIKIINIKNLFVFS